MFKVVGYIFKFLLLSLGSWVLVHIFAALGIFISLAYPLWNFLLPSKLPCMGCYFKKEGDFCLLCKKKVTDSNKSPKSLASVFRNTFIILAFSLLSLGFIYIESSVLKAFGIPPTPRTVSFAIPDKGQYRIGEIFQMRIELGGIKTPINAIQADISYDPEKIEVVEISTQDSFATIFIQKEINNLLGYARLTGGIPNPGFSLERGIFGTIYLKGKQPGPVEISYLDTSMVLANDGRGSNVLKDFGKASYLILPEEIPEEARIKQEVVLGSEVLGQTTDDTRMYFYEGRDVLGSKTEMNPALESTGSQKNNQPSEENPFIHFWTIVGNFNEIIFKFWDNVLTFINIFYGN